MKSVIVEISDYDEDTEELIPAFSLRVFAEGGFEIISGSPNSMVMDDLNNRAIPAPPDGKRRVTSADGLIWAQALLASYSGTFTSAKLIPEAD